MPSHRSIHALFATIWLITAIVFFCSAYDSYKNLSLALPQAVASLDDSFQRRINFNGEDVSQVVDNVIDAHNLEVSRLESSIHDSAALTLKLNLVSGLAAILGLYTQIGAYSYESGKKKGGKEESDPETKPEIGSEKSTETKKAASAIEQKPKADAPQHE